jgi:hypothetical protein
MEDNQASIMQYHIPKIFSNQFNHTWQHTKTPATVNATLAALMAEGFCSLVFHGITAFRTP